jgi:hypothetical protein
VCAKAHYPLLNLILKSVNKFKNILKNVYTSFNNNQNKAYKVLLVNIGLNSITLDVANLQSGVYVVKTMIGGVAATSRLVKN